jgi:hypothetical protein
MTSPATAVPPFSMKNTFVIVLAGGRVMLSSVALHTGAGGAIRNGAGMTESPVGHPVDLPVGMIAQYQLTVAE